VVPLKLSQVHLVQAGEKVSSSHVALLSKLNINPFFYGINVTHVYEGGSVYEASVLDLTKEDLFAKFFACVRKIAALSLAIGYPTTASLPHIVGGAFRKLLYISSSAGYDFKEAKAFLAGGGGGGGGAAAPAEGKAAGKKEAAPAKGAGKKEAAKPKEPEPEPEPEEDDGAMAGMFGDE